MRQKQWVSRDVNKPITYRIRNNFHTRLIIETTPSGNQYDFELGETKEMTNKDDAEYLLSLKYEQSACCGNQSPGPIHYFVMEA